MYNKFPPIAFLFLSLSCITSFAKAQDSIPFFKDAVKEKRAKFYSGIISHSINENLSVPLTAENEEAWISALDAINLTKYSSPFVVSKIDYAAHHSAGRSDDFKKSLLALLNSDHPKKNIAEAKNIFKTAGDDVRLLAMAANYILPAANAADVKAMLQEVQKRSAKDTGNAVLAELNDQLLHWNKKMIVPSLQQFFAADYLPGQVLVFSFQRHDRNFPGLALVRSADGSFLKNPAGDYFSVGQLARSESNMPGYISLGNTPQGIFRMDGFDTSKSFFIGPTTNIQLTMPFEFKASHFYRDSTLNDTVWTLAQYKNLLPENFRNYHPLFGTYYAGKAGRNEIIAHGSTINHDYYKNDLYFPYTPTEGCLVTKEFWNEETGYLQSSDQLLLTQAVKNAGGPKGYLIVIEIDDRKEPVTMNDLRKYLPK